MLVCTVCLLLSARALFYLFPELSNRYEEAKAKGMDNYDRELEETIERLISECERKIQRALKRLEEDDAKAAIAISITEVTQSKEVIEFSKQIKEKMKEIDAFGKSDVYLCFV
jgi:hypothetical protein